MARTSSSRAISGGDSFIPADHGVLEERPGADLGALGEDRAADLRAGADRAAVEQDRLANQRARRRPDSRAEITARGPRLARARVRRRGRSAGPARSATTRVCDRALEDVPARLQVAIRGADVHPVTVQAQRRRVRRRPAAGRRRARSRPARRGGSGPAPSARARTCPALISPGACSPVFSRKLEHRRRRRVGPGRRRRRPRPGEAERGAGRALGVRRAAARSGRDR